MRAGKTRDEREQKDRLEKKISKKATHLLCGNKTKGNQLRFVSLLYLIALVIKASLIYGTNERAQMSDNSRLRENRRTTLQENLAYL